MVFKDGYSSCWIKKIGKKSSQLCWPLAVSSPDLNLIFAAACVPCAVCPFSSPVLSCCGLDLKSSKAPQHQQREASGVGTAGPAASQSGFFCLLCVLAVWMLFIFINPTDVVVLKVVDLGCGGLLFILLIAYPNNPNYHPQINN